MYEIKKPGFVYTVEHIDADGKTLSIEKVDNIIPLVGVNYLLAAGLTGGAAFGTWYIGLFGANRTPVAGDDMTTLLADAEETTEYGGSSRGLITFAAVAEGATTSVDDPTIFDFASAATVQGGFITSGITIGSTSGLLLSAVKFASPKVMEAGQSLKVPVGMALASV